MFDGILEYLNSLSVKEKSDLIKNLKEFQNLQIILEGIGVVVKDKETGNFLIVKEHELVDGFLKVFKKLTLQGIEIIDKRKKIKN